MTWEPLAHVKNATALSDYLQGKKPKQGKTIPEDKTLPVSGSKAESPEAALLDRQASVKPKIREHNSLE